MASIPPYATGADWEISVPLVKDGTAYNMSAATSVSVRIVDRRKYGPFSDAITCTNTSPANWTAGTVFAVIPRTATKLIPPGEYSVEVQVQIGTPTRVHRFCNHDIDVVRGNHADVP